MGARLLLLALLVTLGSGGAAAAQTATTETVETECVIEFASTIAPAPTVDDAAAMSTLVVEAFSSCDCPVVSAALTGALADAGEVVATRPVDGVVEITVTWDGTEVPTGTLAVWQEGSNIARLTIPAATPVVAFDVLEGSLTLRPDRDEDVLTVELPINVKEGSALESDLRARLYLGDAGEIDGEIDVAVAPVAAADGEPGDEPQLTAGVAHTLVLTFPVDELSGSDGVLVLEHNPVAGTSAVVATLDIAVAAEIEGLWLTAASIGSLGVAFLATLAIVYWPREKELEYPKRAAWNARGSWASTLTFVGATATTVLALSDQLEPLLGGVATTYFASLGALFGILVAASPLVYNLFVKGNGDEAKGTAFSFIGATVITLWGVFGFLVLLTAFLTQLDTTGWVRFCLIGSPGALGLVVLYYTCRRVGALQKSDGKPMSFDVELAVHKANLAATLEGLAADKNAGQISLAELQKLGFDDVQLKLKIVMPDGQGGGAAPRAVVPGADDFGVFAAL